jgi:sialidase-1
MFPLFLAAVLTPSPQIAANPEDIFVSATLDPSQPYVVTRIPALARTRAGTLLAFAEGRRAITDQSSNILILRRKPASAKAWTPIQIVAADEPNALNNPCVLTTSSGIWLMYQRYPHGLNERTTQPGFDPEKACRSFVITSKDDGKSWSSPVEITSIVKGPGIQSVASGPGIGIELTRGPHRGRLLFPFNEGANGAYSAFSVFSDDKGKTWKRGPSVEKAPETQPNEVQFAELTDGGVLMNARNQSKGRFRLSSVSRNGGENWDPITPELTLPDPVCQGSLLRFSYKPSILVFSNPADAARRANGTMRISRDEGKTWSAGVQIAPGPFEYSCLCALPNGKVGILFESREFSAAGQEGYRIRYATLEIEK